MDKVSVRELEQDSMAVLERVEHGATLEITVEGRAVAMISPITHRKKWTSAAEVAMALKQAQLSSDQTGWLQEQEE